MHSVRSGARGRGHRGRGSGRVVRDAARRSWKRVSRGLHPGRAFQANAARKRRAAALRSSNAPTAARTSSAREAFNLVLEKYEGEEFGSLVAQSAEQPRRGAWRAPVPSCAPARRLRQHPPLRRAGAALPGAPTPSTSLASPARPAGTSCSATGSHMNNEPTATQLGKPREPTPDEAAGMA